jgi:Flp pilus assembly protein TadG
MSNQKKRKMSGQAIIVLGLVIAVMVLLVIGLLSFEVDRVQLAQEQLRAASDAAALSAAATLASSNNTNTSQAQTTAIDTALTTFQQNSVLGTQLTNACLAATADDQPSANNSSIYVQFLDPNNNDAPVPLGDANGKIVQITATYGVSPAFGTFLGLTSVPVHTVSSGGVPMLDVVLCFDVSASIDDQTPVTFVRRQWNTTTNVINYIIPPTDGASPAGALAEGRIFDIIGPPAIGSSVDGLYPQNLSDSDTVTSGVQKNQYPLHFSEESGTAGSAVGLRGSTNSGSPPGNCPPGRAGLGNTYTYTDLVVNIDGNTTFGGITVNGYAFPNIATVVEAARGNLENTTVFANSKANVSLPASVQPKAGYQAEYLALAAQNVHPIGDAIQAATNFFEIMNTNTNAHFSLVCFTSNAGTSSTNTYNMSNIDGSYGAGGTGNFPCPLISMSSATGSTSYSSCVSTLPSLVAISGTNIGDAVNTAVNQLNANGRAGSTKAIVLFTDGEPTSAGPLDNSDPLNNARLAASKCATKGYPLYTIGLAQNSAIVPSETAILNDTNSNASSGGMAAIAGNGGKFFLVTNVADLNLTFENIARQLVQLVRAGT